MRPKSIALLTALLLAMSIFAVAKDPKPSATLNFLVVKDENGKPVRNASVVLHSVDEKGRQSRGGLQLKTNAEGKASIDGIPYGKLRVQVIAQGLQTYGEDFDIKQETHEFTIKLKAPQGQYSIYDDKTHK